MHHVGLGKQTRKLGQLPCAFVVEGGLQRAVSAVLQWRCNVTKSRQERLVRGHSSHAQGAQLRTVAFDVRSEDASRGLRGATAGAPWIENPNLGTPPGAFESYRTADHAGSGD